LCNHIKWIPSHRDLLCSQVEDEVNGLQVEGINANFGKASLEITRGGSPTLALGGKKQISATKINHATIITQMHIIKVYAKREAEPKKFVRKEKKSASV
jgi:hypothetical protein